MTTNTPGVSRKGFSVMRLFLWMTAITTILAVSWLKDTENRRDRNAQAAWGRETDVLMVRGQDEFARIDAWLQRVSVEPQARRLIEERFSEWWTTNAPPAAWAEYDDSWLHPGNGIEVSADFVGQKLIGIHMGFDFTHICPPPDPRSRTGPAESYRRSAIRLGMVAWVGALAATVIAPHRRQFTAELMVLCGLATTTGLMVLPTYSASIHDALSNSVVGIVMYCVGITLLSVSVSRAGFAARFKLRTLLLVMTATAILMAIGPVGYGAMGMLLLGGLTFAVARAIRASCLRGVAQ